jgi:hypothetical protein
MWRELGEEPPTWTLHDLRRTLSTGLQKLCFSVEVREACLNHLSGTRAGVAGVYGRYDFSAEMRQTASGYAAAAPPSTVMNSRRSLPMRPVLPTERIAQLSYDTRLLRCGISVRPMSAAGPIASSAIPR